jgi:cytochrome b
MTTESTRFDLFTRTIHTGLVVFGITAWLTGELAEDYDEGADWGFTAHSWIGMGLALFIVLRIIYGLFGPNAVRFSNWVPYNKERLVLAWEDVMTLFHFTLPERPAHVGLSALVQAFGLIIFSWMALTGSLLFFFLEPGIKASGALHLIEELHEVGEELIPVYLVLHVGAVILHTIIDRTFIKRIF